jgi:hypothetical protein
MTLTVVWLWNAPGFESIVAAHFAMVRVPCGRAYQPDVYISFVRLCLSDYM